MRKTTLLKSLLLLCALIVGSGSVWADDETITITYEDVTATSYSSTEATFDDSDITFGYKSIVRNNSNGTPTGWARHQVIQCQGSNGEIYNKDAISGLKSIRVYLVVNTNTFTVYSGTTQAPTTNSVTRPTTATGSESVTYTKYENKTETPGQTTTASYYDFDISGNSPTYFRIKVGSSTVYIYKIVVTYEVTASGTTAAPTISGAEDFFTTRTVSISNAPSADGASIYYTLNGDDPTTTPSATCFAYTAPFEVSATTTVKAIAKHADDTNASSVVSKTFTKQTTLNGITALNAAANGTHYVVFTNAQFTYFNGNQGFLNDANAGILYYKSGHPAVKTTYNGICRVEKTVYNLMPELTNIEAIDGECTVTTPDELQAPVVLTASELETNFSDHLARQIQVNNYTVTDAGNFATGKAFYTGWFNPALTVGCTYNLVGYPFNNNGTMQYRLVAATVPVTISASKYASFCSTSALNFTDTDVKAYKAKVDEGKVVLTQVDVVPANEGVILYCETPGDYDIPVAASASAVSENELVGVTSRTLVEWETGGDGKYNYILQQGAFKKATAGGYLKANRAYLHTTYNVTSPGAHDLEMVFDGEVTGISEIKKMRDAGNETFYNLAGQRVNASHKGLVIVNGKKYLNK